MNGKLDIEDGLCNPFESGNRLGIVPDKAVVLFQLITPLKEVTSPFKEV